MSTVYATEPPTRGKVVLHTTHGPLDVELWPREAPLAARNFAKLAQEGYYDGVAFHRLIPGFMLQGGDPLEGLGNTGAKGHIYEEPGSIDPKMAAAATRGAALGGFRDEPHSRLRFVRRGLVACANANVPHSNGAQFFLTLGPCEWLDKKHTIFGRVAGDTVFNLERLAAASEATGPEHDDRPAALLPGGDPREAPRVLRAEVTHPPFEDLGPPRALKVEENAARRAAKEAELQGKGGAKAGGAAGAAAAGGQKAKPAPPATVPTKRNPKLLSFGEDEDEDDEDEDGGGAIAKKKPKTAAAAPKTSIVPAHAALAGEDPALAHLGAEEEDPETRLRLEQREAWEREQRRRREEEAALRERAEAREAAGGGAAAGDNNNKDEDAFEASMRARAEASERERRERQRQAGGDEQEEEQKAEDEDAAAAAEPPLPPPPPKEQPHHHARGAAGRKAAAEGAKPVADAELLRPWHARREAYLQRRRATGGREEATLARLAAFTSALRGGGAGDDGEDDGDKPKQAAAAAGAPAAAPAAEEEAGYDGRVDSRLDHLMPAAWRIDRLLMEEEGEEANGENGGGKGGKGSLDVARLARQRLVFARGPGGGTGAAAAEENDDDYVVDDPRAGGGGRGGGGGGRGGRGGGRGGGGGNRPRSGGNGGKPWERGRVVN